MRGRMGTMLLRISVVVLVVVADIVARLRYVHMYAPAYAQDDPRLGFDCDNYGSQADAQAALERDPSDPNNLDADGNGKACEIFDYSSPPPIARPSPTSSASPSSSASASASATPQPDRNLF